MANFNSAVTGLALARKQTAYDSVWGDCDSLYMLDMWQLRHFNLENSRILEGCTNYNLQYKVAAAETGVKRVLLTASQASGFIGRQHRFCGRQGQQQQRGPLQYMDA